jgi:hypothetical protein
VITLKDGSKIYCKIVKVDSTLHYFVPGESLELSIKNDAVDTYFILQSPPKVALQTQTIAPKPQVIEKPAPTTFTVQNTKPLSESDVHLSQNDPVMLNFYVGFAKPRGDFGSTDAQNEYAGLAKLGFVFESNIILKIAPNFGVSGSYRFQSNGIYSNILNDEFTAKYSGITFSTTATNWKSSGFYGGGFITFPITKDNISMFLDFSVGLPKFTSPELKTTGSSNGSSLTVKQNASQASTVSYLAAIGFIGKINRNVGYNFNFNYCTGKPSFSNVAIIDPGGNTTYTKFTQKIETVNIQAGLSFFIH